MDLEGTGPRGPQTRGRRVRRRLLGALLAVLVVPMLGPLALLAILAETRPGQWFGFFGVAGLGMVVCAIGWAWPIGRPRGWSIALGGFAAAAIGIGLAIARIRPRTGEGIEPGMRSVVLGPGDRMRAGVLGRLPEIDLVKLGAAVATRLAPWMDSTQARRIRDLTLRLEREVEADEAGRTLPGVTSLAVAELTGRPFDAGHAYAYVPAHPSGERLGAVVFLHGNGGNFKINAWAWRAFAEAHRFVIVAPTYGFGFWGEGGAGAVGRSLDDALGLWPIDPRRVYLAGISDGGNGVTRAGRAFPGRFRGLIYVSPTLRVEEIGSPDFARAWQGRPVLVILGDRDVNVRKANVDPAVARMRAEGVDVTYRVFAGEDHFLFFGRSGEVFEAIARWIGP